MNIENLSKRFGDHVAVDQLTLSIRQGEFFSILGPSGSGKTTTLRLIAGLDAPDDGKIFIHGKSMENVPPHQRPVNTVFQHYALFPHMPVWMNVGFGLRMQKTASGEVRKRVEEALAMVKLEGKEQRLPGELSGGEQQRVALARALVNRPAVLLLDEPLGALDQQLRQQMQIELKQIQEDLAMTFICVTHHQEEALSLSSRVAVMHQGRIVQIGTPLELYDLPASMFVAKFVGDSNVLQGTVTVLNGRECVIMVPHSFTVQAESSPSLLPGQTVTLLVRPERLTLRKSCQSNGTTNSLPVRIMKATFSGNEMVYQVKLTPSIIWSVRLPISSRNQEKLRVGENVFLEWKRDEGLLLSS